MVNKKILVGMGIALLLSVFVSTSGVLDRSEESFAAGLNGWVKIFEGKTSSRSIDNVLSIGQAVSLDQLSKYISEGYDFKAYVYQATEEKSFECEISKLRNTYFYCEAAKTSPNNLENYANYNVLSLNFFNEQIHFLPPSDEDSETELGTVRVKIFVR